MNVSPTTKLTVKTLLHLPEMRTFWFFVPFLLLVLVVNFIALPTSLALVNVGLILFIAIILFVTTIRSARLNYETSIERTELKGIVSNLGDALILYDQNFTILFFSPAAEKLFDLKAKSLVGEVLAPQNAEKPSLRRLVQVIFPSLAPLVVSRTKVGVYPQIIDLSFDDPRLDLRVTTIPIAAQSGMPLHFMKIIRDRTRELFLIKSKSEFVTIASHQLRSPVTDVKWALDAMTSSSSEEESATLLQKAHESASHLINVVEDLLDVAKIEEGRFGYEFKPIDLVQFLDTILAGVIDDAKDAGVKIYFDRPKEQLPPFMIDKKKLAMALYNFAENAIRYNVKNGQVIVRVEMMKNKPYADIQIKDTGIGIPADDIPKLFSKFFRAANALKFKTEGSGLGLYIAKNVIQAHGGEVWVESELNRGSTFHLTLPTDFSLVPQHEVAVEE